MGALDFKEIPPAQSGPERDKFELFAREFLIAEGFRIVEHPDRGADGGRDIIAEEDRVGPGGANVVRWLVSCKHKAFSGTSVLQTDEFNVRDRLGTHRCQGFIAFYSTLPSSGLGGTLNGLKPDFEYLQLDSDAIERKLLENPRGRGLAVRYMPKSYNAWMQASMNVAAPTERSDPHKSYNRFFARAPHTEWEAAKIEAFERKIPMFIVIYDAEHSSHSRIDYSLGHFMDYDITKRLVDQHFVPVVGPSSDDQFGVLVPEDDPLENCLLVIMQPDGTVMRREGVYANPDEGLRRVRAVIASSFSQ